jgi:membrane-anchored protein YejM (alkaline phosphatase superfamily)
MTFQADQRRRQSTHPEEWFSILLALIATIGGAIFIGYYPLFKPSDTGGGVLWAVPVWLGFFYLIVQMTFLLFSASQIRALGVLDSVLAIAPVVAGLVLLIQTIISPTFHLSSFQLNSLAVLIVAGASEFLLTIWIRFVLNRRTIGFGPDS